MEAHPRIAERSQNKAGRRIAPLTHGFVLLMVFSTAAALVQPLGLDQAAIAGIAAAVIWFMGVAVWESVRG